MAGDEWPTRARQAAITLAASRLDGATTWGTRALKDLRALWMQTPGHLASDDCLRALNSLDDAPWSTWNNGSGLNSYRLNKLLAPYDIHTKDVRLEGRPNPVKGFHKQALKDAFDRWLPTD